jgi:hypothetical protein
MALQIPPLQRACDAGLLVELGWVPQLAEVPELDQLGWVP